MQKNVDKELKKAIKNVLKTKIGLSMDVLGCIYIRELEDSQIAVGSDLKKPFEKVFQSHQIDEAVDFFIKQRNDLQLGFDYEVSGMLNG